MTKESLDNNKSALTHKITAVCAAYLDKRGFKPIETEVAVCRGWIADLASFVYPSWTERKLLGLDAKSMLNPVTAIVEVKITRGDFKKDIRRKFNADILPAHICYLAYPKGMLRDEEIPERWVGLEAKEDGSKILRRKKKQITPAEQKDEQIIDLIAAVAIRRAHRTRYRELRDYLRMYRAEEREKTIRHKTSHIIQAMVSWLGGDPEADLKECLKYYGVYKVPKYLDREIEKLTAIKKKMVRR